MFVYGINDVLPDQGSPCSVLTFSLMTSAYSQGFFRSFVGMNGKIDGVEWCLLRSWLLTDMTGDGRADIVIMRSAFGPKGATPPGLVRFFVLPSNGDGTFGPDVAISPPVDLRVGDKRPNETIPCTAGDVTGTQRGLRRM